MSIPLLVKRLTATATLPKRAEEGSVGYDLHADLGGADEVVMLPGAQAMIGTGVAVAIPPGCYGRVAPRSGMAAKYGADVLAGVIDPSYRGEIKIILIVHTNPMTICHGDRVAQLVLERVETPAVEDVQSLDDTARGAGGFGSTGSA